MAPSVRLGKRCASELGPGGSNMHSLSKWKPVLTAAAALAVAGCGGEGGSAGSAPSPSPSPSPTPTSTPTPAAMILPPAPFGLTASQPFTVLGFGDTKQPSEPTFIDNQVTFEWSATAQTYRLAGPDVGSGRLVYTFPGKNPFAFSLIADDNTTFPVAVTVNAKRPRTGELSWTIASQGSGINSASALFAIPVDSGAIRSTGIAQFICETASDRPTRILSGSQDPPSGLTIDFSTGDITGTLTAKYDDGWHMPSQAFQIVLDSVVLDRATGSFAGNYWIDGEPKLGSVRGRLVGRDVQEILLALRGPPPDPLSTEYVYDNTGLAICGPIGP
jgi:hypothetical protein